MKGLNLIIGKIALIGLLAVLPIAMSAVEFKNTYRPIGYDQQRARVYTEAPATVFQSTSTLAASGSAWSATPMLGEDGMAYNPSVNPSGPRKMRMEDDEDEPAVIETPTGKQPIGDAVLPLMIMALAFCGVVYLRRRKALKG